MQELGSPGAAGDAEQATEGRGETEEASPPVPREHAREQIQPCRRPETAEQGAGADHGEE